MWIFSGNTNELGDTGEGPRKSFLSLSHFVFLPALEETPLLPLMRSATDETCY